MEKIEFETKTDREILILLAHTHNEALELLQKHDALLTGNGKWGIISKVNIMWWGGSIALGVLGTFVTIYVTKLAGQ